MKTLDWVKSQELPTGGLAEFPGGKAYPEVTGYMIPTLLDWGEIDLANRLADWLVSIQNPDGSFNGTDGKAHVFDTGTCYEGLKAAGRNSAADKARAWLMTQKVDGFYNVRVLGLLGGENILPPESLHIPNYLRSHYFAYYLEGLYLLGYNDFVKEQLETRPRGMQPYFIHWPNDDTDTCATAQIAKLRLLLGMDADPEISILRSLVNSDGSLPHGLVNKKQVLWPCKYYLDVEYLLQQQGYDDRWHKVREWQFTQFDIHLGKWQAPWKPFGISGCFRVRNDPEFLYEAVTSHLPYLDEAVIALQPSDGETNKVAIELTKEFPKVRVEYYPVAPVFITDPEWPEVPENSIRSFVYLSNWALSKCRFSWIPRIEADVIGLSSFSKIVERIKNEPQAKRLYGRVLLNLAGAKRDRVSQSVPRNGGWDECVFPNHPDYHFTRRPKYEVLENPNESECMGWSALHLKRCKKDKIGWNNETYVPFDREHVAGALREFNRENAYPGPDNPLGEECLFEVLN